MYRLEITIPCTSTTGSPSSVSPPTRACTRPAAVSVHVRLSVIAFGGRLSPFPAALVPCMLQPAPHSLRSSVQGSSGVSLADEHHALAAHLCGLLRLRDERPKQKTERKNEPDPPHGHLGHDDGTRCWTRFASENKPARQSGAVRFRHVRLIALLGDMVGADGLAQFVANP